VVVECVARTVTVMSNIEVEVLEIEGALFVAAVTGHDASKQAEWSIARNWQPGYRPETMPDE
jgi:hypothetical protein